MAPASSIGRAIARAAAALILVLVATAVPASAERYIRELPPAGGQGDFAFNDVCKDGFLIGFRAHMGAWMDKIEMICSTYDPGQPWKPRIVEGHGGNGGTAKNNQQTCADGEVLSGITLKFTKDFRQIFGLFGRCRNIETGKNHPSLVILPFDQQQAETESATKTYTCGSNEAAAGISGRYGKHVNAIGLNCGRWPPEGTAAPAPPVASAPSTEVKPIGVIFCQGGGMQLISGPAKFSVGFLFRAAAQGSQVAVPPRGQCAWIERPIAANEPKKLLAPLNTKGDLKSLLKVAQQGGTLRVHVAILGDAFWVTSIDDASVGFVPGGSTMVGGDGDGGDDDGDGGPVDPGKGAGLTAKASASFAGEWKAEADGVSYDMTMNLQGGAIIGQFHGTDGSEGKFSGAPRGNVLRFSWDQTDGNRGTGKFVLSANGSSFKGSYNFGGDPDKVEGTWNGTRE